MKAGLEAQILNITGFWALIQASFWVIDDSSLDGPTEEVCTVRCLEIQNDLN